MKPPLRLAFIGWGAINSRVGELLQQRSCPVEIVGIATLDTPGARAMLPPGVQFLNSAQQLAALKPDLVIEAAGRAAISQWAAAALAGASTLIIASTSAFTDDGLLAWVATEAERHGSRVELASGAIGGMDALAGAAVLGLDDVLHQIIKPPVAWIGTKAEQMIDLKALMERIVFFSGNAREAAAWFPQNANATVVTSLAGVGLDRTRVELVADPAVSLNGHIISAHGAFGRMQMALENRPLATNPKSSELTALSLVRLIEQHIGRVATR